MLLVASNSAAACLRCMEASKLFLRDRAPGTSEPCVGDAEGIAEEEWGWNCASFLVFIVLLFFFGFFLATVAQASSEGWFGRVLDRHVGFCFWRAARATSTSHRGRSMQLQ